MELNLQHIDRVKTISKSDFVQNYLKPQIPVVIENLADDWPANAKWNFDYIKEKVGDKIVPLYDDRPVTYKDGFNEPHASMTMSQYINLLQREPTKYRIFLYNVLKEVPELQEDFDFPDIGLKLLKSLPMLFFGGEDSHTFMHYDIDLANILHFHFQGKKECILYPNEERKHLYKIPHSLITHESIDFSNPDFNQWPALKNAKGYRTELEHGNTLYMPEGYWHYMRYITPGFSMSMRAIAMNPKNLSKAIYNIFIMRNIDNLMRRVKGQKWIDEKNEKAIKNTHSGL
ncbi:cupin-like domain-containing protein [Lutimonas vermicola]|uniref:Cupin-like domain-containing protein n=1 Tax=Lutimonas vermicola TaxID=414288 RepID=A0ABU9L2F0_9FLAO